VSATETKRSRGASPDVGVVNPDAGWDFKFRDWVFEREGPYLK